MAVRRVLRAAVTLVAAGATALAAPSARPTAATAAAPPRPVPILMYHRIAAAPTGERNASLWVPPATLRRQLAGLAGAGYRAVTLERVWQAWQTGAALPAKPVVLSFDDGYSNQYTQALPVLRARGWPGVLNLQVNRLGARGGLSHRAVRAMLAAGWELSAHTYTHPDLTRVSDPDLEREVAGSRLALQEAFGAPVSFFAYPYGRTDPRVTAAVEAAGFDGATTIRQGLATAAEDPFALRRIKVSPSQGPRTLLAVLRRAGAR